MLLDMTRNSIIYEPLARSYDCLTVLASRLDGFLLTHQSCLSFMISACDLGASCLYILYSWHSEVCVVLLKVCTLRNRMHCTFLVTPVQACVDVSGFMTACFISSCKLLLVCCTEGFA